MSFLKKLFQKKPGGSAAGNLLRKVTGRPKPGTSSLNTNQRKDYDADVAEYGKENADYMWFGSTKSVDPQKPQPFDLGNYIKLPEFNINHGVNLDGAQKVPWGMLLGGVAAIFLLPKLLGGTRHNNH